MKVRWVEVDRVKPYFRNPRKRSELSVKKIAASIEEFGWQQPIVCDRDLVIIVGHGRYDAARLLKTNKVPVVVAENLTPEQAAAYRLADNRTNEETEWDLDLLKVELKDLKGLDYALEHTAFDDDELARLLADVEGTAGLTDEDEVPDEPEEPVCAPGDLWLLGRHRLMCGDATSPDAVAELMDGKKAGMVFTDPPWNVAIGLDGNPRHRQRAGLTNDNMSDEEFAEFLAASTRNLVNFCAGDLYCILGASNWPVLDQTLRDHGFHWSATIIWVKDAFVLGRSKYHRRYEPIWYGWQRTGKSSYAAGRDQDDVWEVQRPKRSEEHPTMKPVELPTRAIQNSSAPKDVVLDLFGGAGSTLIACEKLARVGRIMEIDPKYCDVILRRWQNFTGNTAKLEADGQTFAAVEAERLPARKGA
ncbi:MAG: DNA modification methylase [Acidobacteria bacterium]|nr:DNA modification methylase [Acidobacteriota bacterium]